eukprot:RCo030146
MPKRHRSSSSEDQDRNARRRDAGRTKTRSRSRGRDRSRSTGRSRDYPVKGPAPKKVEPVDPAEARAARALQKQVDDLDRNLDEVSTVAQLYGLISTVENTTTNPSLSTTQKLTLYHTTVRKACELFCAALVERTLFFIQRFLTAHKITDIDVITFRFIDRVTQCIKLSERATQLVQVITTGRTNKHTGTLFPGGQLVLSDAEAEKRGKKQHAEFAKGTISLPNTKKLTLPEEIDAYIEAITTRPELSLGQATERLKQMYTATKQLWMEAAVRCPAAGKRLQLPCVGLECKHVQCFELRDFIANILALRRRGKRGAWRCPVCRRIITENTIMLDKLTQSIVPSVPEDCEGFDLHYDGSWLPLKTLRVPLPPPSQPSKPASSPSTVVSASASAVSQQATPAVSESSLQASVDVQPSTPARQGPAESVPDENFSHGTTSQKAEPAPSDGKDLMETQPIQPGDSVMTEASPDPGNGTEECTADLEGLSATKDAEPQTTATSTSGGHSDVPAELVEAAPMASSAAPLVDEALDCDNANGAVKEGSAAVDGGDSAMPDVPKESAVLEAQPPPCEPVPGVVPSEESAVCQNGGAEELAPMAL